jgi:hypothetical protein
MSEDRSKGMYHSLIGKSSLRVVLVMGLLIGLSVLLLAACGGEEAAKGGADQEHKKKEIGSLRVENASGDSAHCGQRCTLNSGQIAFGRHPEYGQLQSAIFTMNLDGSHVSQITHPPRAFATTFRSGPPMGRGSPSFARASRTLISSGLMRQDQVGNR